MHPRCDFEATRRQVLQAGAASVVVTAAPVTANAQAGGASRGRVAAAAVAGTALTKVAFTVNGKREELELDTRTTLLDALREHLHFTGTKKGCDHGQCGAYTVLLDGRPINSCLALAVMQDGSDVTTVEGLARDGTLHPVQQAFIDHDAFQCGYCTPGQICSAVGLISDGRARTRAEIREAMSGNICRCGAYPNIIAAIEEAMKAT